MRLIYQDVGERQGKWGEAARGLIPPTQLVHQFQDALADLKQFTDRNLLSGRSAVHPRTVRRRGSHARLRKRPDRLT